MRILMTDKWGKQCEVEDVESLRRPTLDRAEEFWFNGYKGTVSFAVVNESDQRVSRLIVMAHRDFGYYLNFNNMKPDGRLAVSDRSRLDEVVVCGNDWQVSRGLFVDNESAWKAIESYCADGSLATEVDWLGPGEMPGDGMW